MKFITEEDLRLEYRKQPFTEYQPKEGTRLTPGARQFLTDWGIRLPVEEKPKIRSMWAQQESAELPQPPKPAPQSSPKMTVESNEAWRLGVKRLQAQFLQTGLDLMQEDVLNAGQVFDLERYLARLLQDEEPTTQTSPTDWQTLCPQCTGIGPDNSGLLMEDCFEVTAFHAQSPGGKSIVKLHLLRCSLRELEPQLPRQKQEMAHRIINRLSQMICHSFGGKVCQKN